MKTKRIVVYDIHFFQEGAWRYWHSYNVLRKARVALRDLINKRTAWRIIRVTTTVETVEEFTPCTSTKK